MSIKIINDVFDNSEMRGNDRLVMLSIADNADEENRQAWPSVSNISRKTRIPIRTVWRCIKRCVESGELKIIKHGSKDGGSNLYEIAVERSSRLGKAGGSVKVTGVPPGGIPPVPPIGTLTVIEPSVHRDKGFVKPLVEEMVNYGKEIGLPEEEAVACHDHYEANGWMVGRARMSNWKAAERYWNSNYKKGTYTRRTPTGQPKESASAAVQRILKGIQ